MFSRSSQHRKIGSYGFCVLLLITVAVLLRVIFISNGWPVTNSDEGTMGLNALHILTRGERPIFLYGQYYMGTLEAYLGACFFLLFGGPSLFAFRLGLVVMYAGFLLAQYLLARLLYTKGVALVALFFLCLGSSGTLTLQLLAVGGALETLLFGTLSLLLASWLVLSFHPDIGSKEQPPEEAQRKRFLAYGSLGGVIGLGLWSHILVLPFVCTSLLLLLLFCHRELCTRAILFGVLGFLVGSLPLLIFTILYPSHNLPVTLWGLYTMQGTPLNLWLAIWGAILITIPIVTGANPLCPLSPDAGQWIHHLSLSCMAFQACWGLNVVVVWAMAVFVVIKELRKQCQTFSTSEALAEKEHLVRCTSRLMVLTSVGLAVLCYMTSPNAAIFPITSARYLVGLLVATPAIVASLWPKLFLGKIALTRLTTGWTLEKIVNSLKIGVLCLISMVFIFAIVNMMVTTFRQISEATFPATSGCYLLGLLVAPPVLVACLWPKRSRGQPALLQAILTVYIANIIKICILCFISIMLLYGTVNTVHSIPDTQKINQRQNMLINDLLRLHAPHVYSDYWTCDRLIFVSDERIICSVLNPDLSPGDPALDRFQPLYWQILKQDPHPAYIFDIGNGNAFNVGQSIPTGIAQDETFALRFGVQYHRLYIAGYAVYLR